MRKWEDLDRVERAAAGLIVLGIIVCANVLLVGCEGDRRYRYFVTAPDTVTVRDTVIVRDTVRTPPCWPPGRCPEAKPSGVSAIPFSGEFVAVRYRGIYDDAEIGYLPVMETPDGTGLVESNDTDGHPLARIQFTSTFSYYVPGNGVSGHAYVYAPSSTDAPDGWIRLDGRDTLYLLRQQDTDICSGANLTNCLPVPGRNYAEAMHLMLSHGGQRTSIHLPRDSGILSGRAGKYRYEAGSVVGGYGWTQGTGLKLSWAGGNKSVEIGASALAMACP